MTHSPADVIQFLLIAHELGTDPNDADQWPVFASGEPASPDQVLTVYDTTGTDDGRVMPGGELQGLFGFQVRVRAKDHATGWRKADAIQTELAEQVYQETVHVDESTYQVHAVSKIGDILALGKETPTSKRSVFTVNAHASIVQVA